jgi:hypothetical protein
MTVELPGGVQAWHYPVPPDDFRPLEADEQTLARYGFPHRPKNQRLLRLWKRVLGRPIKILEPRYEIAEGRQHKIADPLTENWSGAQITSAPGQVFENVVGIWTVPRTYADPNDDGESYCTCWIGISDSDTHLLQAGVECDVAHNDTDRDTYAWWTLLPSIPMRIDVPVSAGDSILCAIGAGPPSEQDHSGLLGHIWFANLSQGTGMVIPLKGSYFAATNAEWIVERPAKHYGMPYEPRGPLANYGRVTFTDCSAVITGTKTPADLTGGTNIWMTDVTDNYFLSEGEILDSSTVLCTWIAYE